MCFFVCLFLHSTHNWRFIIYTNDETNKYKNIYSINISRINQNNKIRQSPRKKRQWKQVPLVTYVSLNYGGQFALSLSTHDCNCVLNTIYWPGFDPWQRPWKITLSFWQTMKYDVISRPLHWWRPFGNPRQVACRIWQGRQWDDRHWFVKYSPEIKYIYKMYILILKVTFINV
jgi:hypothetical protein